MSRTAKAFKQEKITSRSSCTRSGWYENILWESREDTEKNRAE